MLGLGTLLRRFRDWWWQPAATANAAGERLLFEVLRVSQAQAEVAAAQARTVELLLAREDFAPLPVRREPSGAEWIVEMDES